MARLLDTIGFAAGIVATLALASPAAAQVAAPKPDAQKAQANDPKQAKAAAAAAAQKAYQSGTKLFEQGKFKDAVPQLTTALAGGGLPAPQMAKALYYRGVANRKLGKPAQAMSDLTTSIWVAGGLNDADRAAAIENRQAAYREAGLGDQAPAEVPRATVAQAPPASAPVAAPEAAPVPPPVATAPPPSSFTAEVKPAEPAAALPWQAAEAPAPQVVAQPVTAPAATQPSGGGVPSPFGEPAADAPPAAAPAAPAPVAAAAPEPAPAAPGPSGPNVLEKAGQSIAQAGSNVSNFFGNLMKSVSGPQAATTSPEATAPSTALAPAPGIDSQTSASPVMTAANPQGVPDSNWGGATEVRSTTRTAAVAPAGTSPVSTGAVPTPVAAPAQGNIADGKFVLQVGAVRSRAEAEELAQRVRRDHAGALGGRNPLIDEAVIGNFGSFHRVRVGPYADAKEPGKLCSTLIKTGYDCLVVTQ